AGNATTDHLARSPGRTGGIRVGIRIIRTHAAVPYAVDTLDGSARAFADPGFIRIIGVEIPARTEYHHGTAKRVGYRVHTAGNRLRLAVRIGRAEDRISSVAQAPHSRRRGFEAPQVAEIIPGVDRVTRSIAVIVDEHRSGKPIRAGGAVILRRRATNVRV